MSTSVAGHEGVAPPTSWKWGWFVALGVALIVLGVIAWIDVAFVTVASVIFIGASLVVSGVFQIAHAFMTRQWRGFITGVLCGVLYLVGGFLIMNEPVQGAVVLTLLVAATFIVGGIFRIVLALRHRDVAAWGLILFSGVVSIGVGYLLYASLPWSGLWVLGTLIAVELVVQGASWLSFGLSLRKTQLAAG
ncbi:HdeD family acid-resistance protein [Limobrevibacterium gyesilva]|uniref:HdeD family acid-resistance protein n=1 Tax=Limobrevibacterium gyesilva TaxID=2991712 RepID=A0AA41YMK7_9PROT|nr:HdeD family acid-resistance protein [Limobrevibacterium gyesilva]MCW3476669.1 HdeD family acid-resistance protein [Limobrevibacterium gyesilva]